MVHVPVGRVAPVQPSVVDHSVVDQVAVAVVPVVLVVAAAPDPARPRVDLVVDGPVAVPVADREVRSERPRHAAVTR